MVMYLGNMTQQDQCSASMLHTCCIACVGPNFFSDLYIKGPEAVCGSLNLLAQTGSEKEHISRVIVFE